VQACFRSPHLPFVFLLGIAIAFHKRVSPNKENTKTSSRSGKTGRVWILPVGALALLGIWFWSRADKSGASATLQSGVKSTLHLESFVLNVADADQRSYLRVGIDLGLSKEQKRGDEAPPVAKMRDTILSMLAVAKLEDLLTADGKTKLKENVLHALQERTPEAGVEEIYFTEFLIQR
jgi:flagellar basal body-associated protein FliL